MELDLWPSLCDLERFCPCPSRHLAVADVVPCEPALHPHPSLHISVKHWERAGAHCSQLLWKTPGSSTTELVTLAGLYLRLLLN